MSGMFTPKNAYEKLQKRFEKIIDVNNAAAILQKDMEVYMPENSAKDRTRQLMALAEVAHDLIKTPEIEQWLDPAEAEASTLTKEDRRTLPRMRRKWVHEASLPDDLVREIARLDSEGELLHTELRK